MNGEYKYLGECLVCNTSSAVTIYEEEETPVFCPLCGNTVDFDCDEQERDEDDE